MPDGNGERGVFHVRRFFAENGAQQTLFGSEFGFALWRDFSDENVAGLHFRTDADDAIVAEIAERFFADVWNVARDFFGTELGVAGADLKFVDVDGRVDVLLHDFLGNHDGILEVVAVPRHERDEHVAAEREFAVLRVRAVSDDVAFVNSLTLFDDRLLVHTGARVGAHELAKFVNVDVFLRVVLDLLATVRQLAVFREDDLVGGDAGHFSIGLGDDDRLRVPCDFSFHAGADERSFAFQKRHALALHVRAHERAVRVVMFKKRDQAGRDRHKLLRRDVHVVNLVRFDFKEVAAVTDGNFFAGEVALLVDRGVRLRHEECLLAIAGEEVDLVGYAAFLDLAIRRFDEAEFVDRAHRCSSS